MDKVIPKFKKGDKLRCTSKNYGFLTENKIYRALEDLYYLDDAYFVKVIDDKNIIRDFYTWRFEKVKEPENFQPGDMVECIDDCGCLDIKKGKIYKILKINKHYLYVDTQTKDTGPYMDTRFKKIDNFTKQTIAAEEKHPLNSIGPLPEVYTQNGQVIIKIQGNVEILVPMGMTINLNTNGNKAWVCLIP